jgi:Tol biopolymer transport system component
VGAHQGDHGCDGRRFARRSVGAAAPSATVLARLSLSLATLLALGAIAAGSASASYIVYVCGANLCEVNPDGTGQRALTTDGGGAAGSYSTPSLSRDGTLLAFDKGNTAYAMTMPGGTVTTLNSGSVLATFIRPDGGQVAFIKDQTEGLESVPWLFSVSPDGSSLAAAQEARFALTAGWLGTTLLRDGYSNTAHVCSPPAGNCAARSICPAENHTCGSPAHDENVAEDPLRDLYDPAGSPDGSKVAAMAVTYPEGSAHASPTGGAIALYNASTAGHLTDLTSGNEDAGPAWSPDGSAIAFTRGSSSIYTVPAGGGAPQLLVTGGIQPTWGGGPGDTLSAPGSTPVPTTPAPSAAQGATGAVTAKRSTASVSLSCSAGSGACTVQILVTVSETFRGHTLVALSASGHPRVTHKTVVVGHASVTLAPGQSRSVTVSLNGAGKALLSRRGKLLVKVTVTQGSSVLKTAKLTLHLPAKKHKR